MKTKITYLKWLQQYHATGELRELTQFVAHHASAYMPFYNQQVINRLVNRTCRKQLITAYGESKALFKQYQRGM